MSRMTRRTLIGGCVAALLPTALWADRDHDQAHRAVQSGEALPLFDILARVRSRLGGEIVGVAFRRKRNRWVYEFKVIEPRGQLVEVYVDARRPRFLRREEH